MTVTVVGLTDVRKAMKAFAKDAWPIYKQTTDDAAKQAQARIKAAAPIGPTGNLRSAIRRLATKDTPGKRHAVVYISRSVAKHFGLVIFGSAKRFQKSGTIPGWGGERPKVKFKPPGKSVGRMKPNPFFRQAIENELPRFKQALLESARGHVNLFKSKRRRKLAK